MNGNDNYTQDKLDDNARDYDDAPPQPMTLVRAQALVDAHRDGRLMSDELLARARECLKDEQYWSEVSAQWTRDAERQ